MIKKFLSNAMLSIVMDKQAKEKFQAVQENRRARKQGGDSPMDPEKPAEQGSQGQPEPMDRKQLIREAMALHKEKSKVLDDLTLNEKRRLQLLALQTMMGKGDRGS